MRMCVVVMVFLGSCVEIEVVDLIYLTVRRVSSMIERKEICL